MEEVHLIKRRNQLQKSWY